ncbi:MAG: FapA family protein [Desulfobacterales bacterium]|nr:FapA family protein [Desulfobacterales bacterium]
MPTTETPKLLVLETNPEVSGAADRILSRDGWQVVIVGSTEDAAEQLRTAGSVPFALVISGSCEDASPCIDFLASVSSLSPLTQRMLWLPLDQPELLIDAVNTASIHACVTYPLEEEDLKIQAKECLERFNQNLEQDRFRKMIGRHNKKMFLLAKNLKKKRHSDRLLLDEKKVKRFRLEYELRKREREVEDQSGMSLGQLLRSLSIDNEPELLFALFVEVTEHLRGTIRDISQSRRLDWEPEGLGEILHREDHGDNTPPQLCDELITYAYRLVLDASRDSVSDTLVDMKLDHLNLDGQEDTDPEDKVARYYELNIEDNGLRAWLHRKQPIAGAGIEVTDILDYMTDHEINYGRVPSEQIIHWLEKGDEGAPKFLVAEARMPVEGKDGCVTYHFPTHYVNPGAMREDGSIDFRERGEVPHVEAGNLLAVKQAPKPGEMGVSVFGEEIFTPEPLDPAFVSGHGTTLSEDGLSMHAVEAGQPHVDPLGTISVNPEYVIQGDVDFNTGNIDFKGNVVVRGTIKQGFNVSAVNLTANEVEGATLSLSGDLNVSTGITDANIKTVGNIQAKFIHNSTVLGFGDFHVLKEIIDSEVTLSGCCDVRTGHVIASSISARQGIHAGKVGTPASAPPLLRVGTEKHIVAMLRNNKNQLSFSLDMISGLKEEIDELNAEDRRLESRAAEKTQIQKGLQEKIEMLKLRYVEAKEKGATVALSVLTRELKKILGQTKKAAEELQSVFAAQDRCRRDIERRTHEINRCEEENIRLMDEKRHIKEYAAKGEPDPTVTIHRNIIQKTRIQAVHSNFEVDDDIGPVKIKEVCFERNGRKYYQMEMESLK